MAKKNRKKQDLPEGMSRRQAKLAARAAERAAFEKDPRPYGELPFETTLVAVQEFVPSATITVDVIGASRPIQLCTVLPGGAAALVRAEEDGGEAYVALQTRSRSNNPNRDLAYALAWARDAKPGSTLENGAADGSQPNLVEILDKDGTFEVTEHDNFAWWFPAGAETNPQVAQIIQMANDSLVPSVRVEADVPGTTWWVHPGDKAHIRWVRQEKEEDLLRALARIAARGELKLGENTKFAGVFRTHDLVVPVWDLPADREPATYAEDLVALNAKIEQELSNDAQLNADERKQLENIKSRQVTIR